MSSKERMYKSQLQELCQRRSWPLPDYTTVKEGTPHRPYFKATVAVNGLSFHTSDFLNRAKDAQIEAAKIALAHFTLPPPAPERTIVVSTAQDSEGIEATSSIGINVNKRPITHEITTAIEQEHVRTPQKALGAKRIKHSEELHMYKNQLQSIVMKKGFTLPIYTFECEGPPHNSRFKSKVTVNGQTYECPDSFRTLKESEHAAAKIALVSLVPPESQEVSLDNSFFKNLLQELAQKSGLELPTYDTIRSGVNHMPTFVSTVIVGGETFCGEEAKTKKLAEMNAAKVAYSCISQRGNLGPSGGAPICIPKGLSASIFKAMDTCDLRGTNKSGASSKLFTSQGFSELPVGGDQEAPKQFPSFPQIGCTDLLGSPNLDRSTQIKCKTPSPNMHASPREAVECLPLSQVKGSSPKVPSNVDMLSGPSSSLCNIVRVSPQMFNMDFPVGAVVHHFDDKWVAVRFPENRTGN